MKHVKLDENAILNRMSNGELSAINGGVNYAQTLCSGPINPSLSKCTEQPTNPLCNCLAGCGCNPQSACNGCTAEV